jgi:hypothetical protein
MTRKKIMPEVGKTYFGPHGSRLTVLAIDGDVVSVMRPVSLARDSLSLAAMQEFIAGSDRRTYRNASGTVRTKVTETKTDVTYIDPSYGQKTITRKSWATWRKSAK